MRKAVGYYLNQVTKFNVFSDVSRHHVPAEVMHLEGWGITYAGFLPKMHNLTLILRKYKINPHWETFYKTNGLYVFFKNVNVMKGRQTD